MKILVAGGAAFVGSHLCPDQLASGFELLKSRPEGFTKAILWL